MSLQFVFLWLTAAAIFVALAPLAFGGWSGAQEPIEVAIFLSQALLYSGSLAAWLYVWKVHRGQRITFPAQPGHWFALLLGLQYAGGQLSLVTGNLMDASELGPLLVPWAEPWVILFYATQGFGWFIVFRAPFQQRTWRVFCGAIAVMFAGRGSMELVNFALPDARYWPIWLLAIPTGIALLCAAITAIIAVVQDSLRWRQYDWLHWLGVGTLMVPPLTQVAVIAIMMVESGGHLPVY